MASRYGRALEALLRRSFPLWEALGVHVTPNHFYQPVPDVRRLPETLWSTRLELEGVDLRLEAQLRLLDELARYRDEYEAFPRRAPGGQPVYYLENDVFPGVDGQVLHAMVRHLRPARVVEVGSGLSTIVIAGALERNGGGDLTSIDPHPPEYATRLPGVTRHLRQPVQEVNEATFERLAAGDILFVDASHVVAIGSDVVHMVLRILPNLAPGVVVHFHDVFLPGEYPREWLLKRRRFWNEQYLLHAFLAFNGAFEVLLAGNHLRLARPEALAAAFGAFRADGRLEGRASWPGSFWIRRTG